MAISAINRILSSASTSAINKINSNIGNQDTPIILVLGGNSLSPSEQDAYPDLQASPLSLESSTQPNIPEPLIGNSVFDTAADAPADISYSAPDLGQQETETPTLESQSQALPAGTWQYDDTGDVMRSDTDSDWDNSFEQLPQGQGQGLFEPIFYDAA